MRRSAYCSCCSASYPRPLGYFAAFQPVTRTKATATAIAASVLLRKLEQQLPVGADGDVAVALRGHPLPPEAAHAVEVVLAVVRVADRTCEQLRTARRHDDSAADLLHDLCGLALCIRGDDHGPRDGEDPVEPARHDVPREPGREPDDVNIGGGQRHRAHVARLVVAEPDLPDLEQLPAH